ncbi:transposase [Bathymodiolus japonicus methanotrophic gill symbiont]|uniref:transposase n=1 Tax=Bathymodiolus japonicus methanotrophic gill symbiont TaxID=113269 RepID=UPI003B837941
MFLPATFFFQARTFLLLGDQSQNELFDKCKNTKNTSHSPIQWTAEKKLSAIIETSTLSEQECNEYCRTRGLYKAELESWKTHFIKGSEQNVTQEKTDKNVLKQLRSENKKLGQSL